MKTTPVAFSILLLIGSASTQAFESDEDNLKQRDSLLAELVRLESESHLERIRILEMAEDCIQGAGNFREYRSCEKRENAARKAFREQHKPKKKALREELKAFRQQVEDNRF